MVGTIGACWASRVELSLGLAMGFVIGHFFLFCNVIRMARRYELSWAAVFLLLSSGSVLFTVPAWHQTFLVAMALTVLLVGMQVRSPSYHGVLWERVNPGLKTWWQMHGQNVK